MKGEEEGKGEGGVDGRDVGGEEVPDIVDEGLRLGAEQARSDET